MFPVPDNIHTDLWELRGRKKRLFLVRVVRGGFVEPLIFELVLEQGRIWTGGQCRRW